MPSMRSHGSSSRRSSTPQVKAPWRSFVRMSMPSSKVTVNVADGPDKEKLRKSRLKLLNEIRDATPTVADFSRIEG
jgi:glycyl-tRNA synthetase beta subunit